MFALSGLDIALWDIAGKRVGKPLHELLGGAKKKQLPCYASLVRYGGSFDGFHATPAAVSKTCLVRFDNNRYSVSARAVGRPAGFGRDHPAVAEGHAVRHAPARVQYH